MTDQDAAQNPNDPTPVAVFHDAALKRLEIQIGTFDALDAKAWNALSIGGAILPITFGLLGFSDLDVPRLAWILMIAAGAAFAVLLYSAWRITSRTGSLVAGEPITILGEYVDNREFPGEGLLLWLARGYRDATVRNERTLLMKAEYVGRACTALYVESALLALAAIVTLWRG